MRMRSALVVAAVVVLALVVWKVNVFDVRARPPFGSVAAAFDDPPAYPGYTWTRERSAVSEFELVTIAGPAHCDWQTATFLMIGWPPPATAPTASNARQYVRDTKGVLGFRRLPRFERGVALPPDAKATGHRLGAIELYVSPSDDERWIYLVGPADIERWPRADPMVLCA